MDDNKIIVIGVTGLTKAEDIKGSYASCISAQVPLVEYIKRVMPVLSLDRNPRKPMYKNNVHSMVHSLHEKPEFFAREHPGISICLDSPITVTHRNDGTGVSMIHATGTPYVFNGGHTTMALAVFALEVVKATIGASPTWEKVLAMVNSLSEARRFNHLPAAEFEKLNAVKVPVRVYFPKKTSAKAMQHYIAEICDTARNVNSAASLSKSASAEASGLYATIDSSLTTKVQWKDGFGPKDKYRRDTAIHILGLCVNELQTRFPDLKTRVRSTSKALTALSVHQALNTLSSCVDNFVAMMALPSVMDRTTNVVKDVRVKSMLSKMQDLFNTYDLVGKYFTELFHKPRSKSFRVLYESVTEVSAQRHNQCPFGTQTTDESIVPPGLILLLVYGSMSLLRYDDATSEYSWIMRPDSILETEEGRAALSANVRTMMDYIRDVFKDRSGGGFFYGIRKMFRDTSTWSGMVRQAWTRTCTDLS